MTSSNTLTANGLRSWRCLIAGLLLSLLVAAVYYPVLTASFINYDDNLFVYENAHVRRGLTAEGIRWAFSTAEEGYWRPVIYLSHMADVSLYGLRAGGHHLTSVLFHLISTLILFHLLLSMTGSFGGSVFASAIFAAHPLQVESVAWVAERKGLLAGLFWVIATGFYAHYARRGSRRSYALVLAFMALGFMSKPVLMTFPIVLLVLDWWPLGRFGGTANSWSFPLSRLLLEKVPFLALAALWSLATFRAEYAGTSMGSLESLPLTARLGLAPVAYVRYLRKVFWPKGLSVFYPHPGHAAAGEFAASLLLLAAVTLAAWAFRRRFPALAAGWAWFLVTLAPSVGLVQVSTHFTADRYMYLPIIGPALALAWTTAGALRRLGANIPAIAGLIILALLAATANRQASLWQEGETLFRHAVEVTPDSWLVRDMMGEALMEKGRWPEAAAQFQEALRLEPGETNAVYSLASMNGAEAMRRGDYASALEFFDRAAAVKPEDASVPVNRASALFRLGRAEAALDVCREALSRKPDYAPAHNQTAVILESMGRRDEALRHYREALRLDPGYAAARRNLESLQGQPPGDAPADPRSPGHPAGAAAPQLPGR